MKEKAIVFAKMTATDPQVIFDILSNIESIGYVSKEELIVLANTGIPIMSRLYEAMGVDIPTFQTILKFGAIKFDYFEKALDKIINEAEQATQNKR